MATFFIKHITKYTFSDTVIDGATLTRLHPINDDNQKVMSHLMSVTNNPFIDTFFDFYNNRVGTFMIIEPHDVLNIVSDLEVVTFTKSLPDDSMDAFTQWEAIKSLASNPDYIDFLTHKPFVGSTEAANLFSKEKLKSELPYKIVLQLCEYVYQNFNYTKGITSVNTTLDEVWELKAGVCQDFTTVLLQLVRMTGIPARYVSGYICPGDSTVRGEGATHAWIEAYIPFYGWFGVDPTNNSMADENYVKLAVGRNYNDCSPVKGVFKGQAESTLEVRVEVKTNKKELESTTALEMINTETTNSYKRNLERIQQQQQQQ